jgi:hypothetical protein
MQKHLICFAHLKKKHLCSFAHLKEQHIFCFAHYKKQHLCNLLTRRKSISVALLNWRNSISVTLLSRRNSVTVALLTRRNIISVALPIGWSETRTAYFPLLTMLESDCVVCASVNCTFKEAPAIWLVPEYLCVYWLAYTWSWGALARAVLSVDGGPLAPAPLNTHFIFFCTVPRKQFLRFQTLVNRMLFRESAVLFYTCVLQFFTGILTKDATFLLSLKLAFAPPPPRPPPTRD